MNTSTKTRLLQQLSLLNRSKRTLTTYLWCLKGLEDFIGKTLEDATLDDILAFLNDGRRGRGLSASWQRVHVGAFRFVLIRVLDRADLALHIPYAKAAKTQPSVLTPIEMERLFAATKNPRFRMAFRLGYATGMRVGEIVNVQVTDIRGARVAGASFSAGTLNISSLAKGMYTLSVSDGQKVFHQRFVKE